MVPGVGLCHGGTVSALGFGLGMGLIQGGRMGGEGRVWGGGCRWELCLGFRRGLGIGIGDWGAGNMI